MNAPPAMSSCDECATSGQRTDGRAASGATAPTGVKVALAGAAAVMLTAVVVPAAFSDEPADTVSPRTADTGIVIVVAPDGDDSGPGTADAPLAEIQEAVDRAGPGDTIVVRGGTYVLTENITITTSGEPGRPITLTAHEGERVIIDGDRLPASRTPVGGGIPRPERGSIHQEASFWRIEGLELIRGPYCVYCHNCDDNEFRNLITRDNYETGFQLQGDSSRNLIVNLDSHGNHDPRKNGESADGPGIKEGRGEGNRVVGARLWNNADGGFDAREFRSAITIEDSVAYGNGVNRWDLPNFSGDGNGFKLGGGTGGGTGVISADHVLRNPIAFRNAVDGVVDNGNPGNILITRTTTFDNGRNGFTVNRSASELRGNLSVLDPNPVSAGSSTSVGNSWNLPGPWNADSVLGTGPGGVTGPRGAGGSIPSTDFLVPRDGTDIGARF
ncbi:chondroitinase-B domain-containing protein [Streptomyces sp. ST2-7A]|uniref:right-handed parallel beta-helix repeat-containing protein n=1 Tax=Streptomyces sp. ST2-7A TaxID=2907214 RepID=UPI001F1EBF12|nr:chondroitinase-B domain-containing protein [Streptomyces sp. ST2-7A]MCE7081008.1 pectate lyase [Streptomyces sp. ST2-7A]